MILPLKPNMGRSKIMKRVAGNRKQQQELSVITSLPTCLITEVLARVASSSITDLFNAKLSCKELHEAVEDDHVYRHVSMEKFPVVPWRISTGVSSFLNRCKDIGNPEALFRQGLIDYFSSVRVESGLELLEKAANLKNMEATYVLGVILSSNGNNSNSRLQGLKLFHSLEKSKRVEECRKRLKTVLRQLWINNFLCNQQEPACKTCMKTINGEMQYNYSRRGWPSSLNEEDEEENSCCESCKWDYEIASFCNMLRGV